VSITGQPASESVAAGQTGTFSVTATGTGALSYQWYLNGTAISGATSATYTTPATTTAESGAQYTVVVTDSTGPVTSSVATLTVTAASSSAIASSQSWANAAVSSVNSGVANLLQAQTAGQLPSGSLFAALPIGTTVSGMLDCGSLGTSGSGTVSYTETENSGTPVSFSFTYNNCVWTSDGETYDINGTGTLTYTNYIDSSDYTFSLDFDFSYSFSGNYNSSGSLNNATETCTFSNSAPVNCSYNFGNDSISGGYVVSTSGTATTVTSATVTTTIAGASGTVTITYNNWVYDSTLGYATSGSVTITDSEGDSATITANGGGQYTVTIVADGETVTFTVTTST
jgi:hypothetical protein